MWLRNAGALHYTGWLSIRSLTWGHDLMIRYTQRAVLSILVVVLSPAVAASEEATTLKAIMQGLRNNLVAIGDGVLNDDFDLVARGADDIAGHPRIPADQVKLVAEELGEEMAAFKALDTAVHDLSLEISAAAQTRDRESVVSGYHRMVDGCVACHDAYKARVSAALGNNHESGTDMGLPILEKEISIRAPLGDVWDAWTTAEGLKFISSTSNIELRVNGPYEWFLDGEPDDYGRRGSVGSHVLAFLPYEMIAFSWTFPPDIPELRYADERTQVVVLFNEISEGVVHVRLRELGWKEGEPWQRGWEYFDHAWGAVLAAMKEHLE